MPDLKSLKDYFFYYIFIGLLQNEKTARDTSFTLKMTQESVILLEQSEKNLLIKGCCIVLQQPSVKYFVCLIFSLTFLQCFAVLHLLVPASRLMLAAGYF